MQIKALTPDEYISKLPDDRKESITKLRKLINDNIPENFKEEMNYGMIGWVVPHSVYPAGYHAKPEAPLPFLNIASQKSHIAIYHMGIYADNKLMNWFTDEFKRQSKLKLDMGKSCIRFKKSEHIPYDLIGELAGKMTSQEWIDIYEFANKKK